MTGGQWAGRTVLVTGAAGFLGGWVTAEIAARGGRVVGLDIAWDRWTGIGAGEQVDGDVRERSTVAALLSEAGVDTVLHLAAQSIVGEANLDPAGTFDHNIRGTWELLEACRITPGIRAIVVASSDKAYGDAGGVAYEESMPLAATNPYDASKAGADLVARSFATSFGMPVAITRCGNLYGGGDRQWSRLIPGSIRSVLAGVRPILRSDGTTVRDYLYVRDAADGVLALGVALPDRSDLQGEAFNLSAAERLTALDALQHILRAMDSSLDPDIRDDAVNEIADQRVSAAKIDRLLGWRATTPFQEGIASTIDWYRDSSVTR